jgi:hypothetical protein
VEEAGHFEENCTLESGDWQKESKPLKHRGTEEAERTTVILKTDILVAKLLYSLSQAN